MRADVAIGAFTFTPVLTGRRAFLFLRFLRHPLISLFWLLCALVSRGPMCIIYPPPTDHSDRPPPAPVRIALSVLPPPDEPNKPLAALKIVGGCGALLLIGVGLYWAGKRRAQTGN